MVKFEIYVLNSEKGESPKFFLRSRKLGDGCRWCHSTLPSLDYYPTKFGRCKPNDMTIYMLGKNFSPVNPLAGGDQILINFKLAHNESSLKFHPSPSTAVELSWA